GPTLGNYSTIPPGLWNWSLAGDFDFLGEDGALVPVDVTFGLRMFITSVYLVVCAGGILGNGLVMYLIWSQKGKPTQIINIFVFALAVADLQFSLTLPFWATEMALDFRWPFGLAMCKAVPSLTVLSIYANVFLLTTMSVTRYWSVASAFKNRSRMSPCAARWITVALWALALVATVPTLMYTSVVDVASVELCLFRFSTSYHLGIYHLQRVVVTFVIPLVVILTSYILLLRLLRAHQVNHNHLRRQKQVSTTVRLVVSCFFVCWFPNHVVTVWGVLVKFGAVSMGSTFYFLHTYAFPLTTCLAHANSCLNPVLYCLMRHEFRETMKQTFWRLSSATSSFHYISFRKSPEEGTLGVLPQNTASPLSVEKEASTSSAILEPGAKDPKPDTEIELIPGAEMPM
uniref:Relaxin family peptide/INSL5 receptor 4 n=1 Tax=Salvator merianae TaxID=96440 RepID=A0A8D0CDD9_SALMN